MLKYRGLYRVQAERSIDGDVMQDSEIYYLTCITPFRGCEIRRYSEDLLELYIVGKSIGKANNVSKMLKENNIEIIKETLYDIEGLFRFKECDLDKVAELVNVNKVGASIHPHSIKNHPDKKRIQQEKRDNMSDEEKERYRMLGEKLKESRWGNVL